MKKKIICFCGVWIAVLLLVNTAGRALGLYRLRFILLGVTTALSAGFFFLPGRGKRALAFICAAALALGAAGAGALWVYGGTLRYPQAENSFLKSDALAGKRVLIVAPHQDDETNLAYAAIAAYRQAGSRVSVVYLTNGDYYGIGETRLQEAAKAAALYGIAQDDVYFLGYGDRWEGTHLYNRTPDEIATSADGRTQTYGTGELADVHTRFTGEPASYTRTNCVEDIRRVIDSVRPDVIFATDCDAHPDHRACSLFFEEALGALLLEDATYRPAVFKGYAYATAWNAPDDFYDGMLLETAYPWEDVSPYRWSERVRFPLPQGMRAYTLHASDLWEILCAHASQDAVQKGAGILNGDEVFFERRTDSWTLTAHMEADAPGAEALRDFKLRDSADVNAKEAAFDAGVWRGERVAFSWDEPVDIAQIALCDAPDGALNTGEVRLFALTSQGAIETVLPAPDAQGRRTVYDAGLEGVARLELTFTQGPASLCEVELLPDRAMPQQLLKLTDAQGQFVYALTPDAGTHTRLGLYGWEAEEKLALTLTDAQGNALPDAAWEEDGAITVGPLERGRYTLRAACGEMYDEVALDVGGNGAPVRWAQKLEALVIRAWTRLSSGAGTHRK